MVIVLAIAATPSVHRAWKGLKNTEDFAPTYRAAQAMWNHQDIREATRGIYLYSPLVAFIFQPLTLFPEHTAALVWIVLSACFIFAAAIVAASEVVRRFHPRPNPGNGSQAWLIAAAALIFSYDKIHAEFRLMQVDALLIFGFALILPWLDRKSWITGLIVGLVANVKYLALIFIPYFVLKRNYRAALGSLLSFVLFMMLPAIQVGPRLAGSYASDALGGLAKLVNLVPRAPDEGLRILPLDWDRSISFTSAIFRATGARGFSDLLVDGLIVLAAAIVVGAIILVARYHRVRLFIVSGGPDKLGEAQTSLEWAALIVLALIFSPQIMARHMLLLLFVFIVAMQIFLDHHRAWPRFLLIGAMTIVVVGLSFPFRAFGFEHQLETWRAISGASWCAFLLIVVVIWTGSALISPSPRLKGQRVQNEAAEG